MVLGEAVDAVEGDQAGGGQDPDLPHPAPEALALHAGLGDQVGGSGQQ